LKLRTAADPQAILPAIREVVAQVTRFALFDVKTESNKSTDAVSGRWSAAGWLLCLLALVLACVGLYGLLSYEVSRRTRESDTIGAGDAERVLKLV